MNADGSYMKHNKHNNTQNFDQGQAVYLHTEKGLLQQTCMSVDQTFSRINSECQQKSEYIKKKVRLTRVFTESIMPDVSGLP